MSFIVPFLIYSAICFVVSYILVEYGQRYIYDEVTPYLAPKAAIGALLMGAMLAWTRPSFDTMFTAEVHWTALTFLLWAVVFILLYRFQPLHGGAFALIGVLLIPGLATIAVKGITAPTPIQNSVTRGTAKPLRKGAGIDSKPAAEKPAP